ncbi:hypothetical protein Tco_1418673 [Tanacetum coccineum]
MVNKKRAEVMLYGHKMLDGSVLSESIGSRSGLDHNRVASTRGVNPFAMALASVGWLGLNGVVLRHFHVTLYSLLDPLSWDLTL